MIKKPNESLYNFAAKSGKLGFLEKQKWEITQPVMSVAYDSVWKQVSSKVYHDKNKR